LSRPCTIKRPKAQRAGLGPLQAKACPTVHRISESDGWEPAHPTVNSGWAAYQPAPLG